MKTKLSCSTGQYSHAGSKPSNQDFCGIKIPEEPYLTTKGIAIAIADGISSSHVSHVASQSSVKTFLEDYYCTSETWSVKNAAQRVLRASNSWLVAQNYLSHEHRTNKDKGYVCTFSSIILKSNTAYLFHVGDSQISRIQNVTSEENLSKNSIEILTNPHREKISNEKSYLSRALGITQKLEIDYQEIALEVGDIFILTTDGVYEFVDDQYILRAIDENSTDLAIASKCIVNHALEQGSDDNLTVQIIRIDSLPSGVPSDFLQRLNNLPFPPELQPRMNFDGYAIIRDLHKTSRSHVVLAQDQNTGQQVVLKAPSIEGRQNADYVERFLMEEWIANRLSNAHIVKTHQDQRKRNFCYVVSEYIEGISLSQWMVDNPNPSLDSVRSIVEQVAKGLQAFHRQEMLHQDLRPRNIMIDNNGTVKIIDFGSTFVSGIDETHTVVEPQAMPGTAQFLAPEYFLGEFGTKRSDLYSLACISYFMLSGRSPYGTAVAKATTRIAQQRLVYQSVLDNQSALPVWVDLTLKKALQADPDKRYSTLSQFIQDLRKPNPEFINQSRPPLIERDPVRVWQGISAILSIIIVYLFLK